MMRRDTLAEQMLKDEKGSPSSPLTLIDEVMNLYNVDVHQIQRSLKPRM
jgi:hypothetical protein